MKRFYLLIASMLVSLVSLAQWTKPQVTAQPFATDTEYYLFNTEAEAFFVGANDWGTRASVSPIKGHKVKIEEFVPAEGQEVNDEDLPAYYLTNYVLDGGMKNQWGYMFLDNYEAIYVDNTMTGKKNNLYQFPAQGNNVYRIGLSPVNETYTDPAVYLGVVLAKQDTRLYFCDPIAHPDYEGCQIDWIFVTEADYQNYILKREIYDAAMELGALIQKAEGVAGVDATVLANAKAVYNNPNSTAQQLKDAFTALGDALKVAEFNTATVDNPVEVLVMYGYAQDFSNGATGWTSTTGAQNKGADNGNNAKDFAVTGNHYENWSGQPFSPGKIYATVDGVPAGVYHLNALAFSNTGNGAFLYVADGRTEVTATQIDIEQAFDAYAYVKAGQLELGLDIPVKGPGWVGLDNVNLYYLGNNAEAHTELVNKIVSNLPDYEGVKAQASVVAAYNAAVEALQGATDANFEAAYTAYIAAAQAMAASVAAYAPYVEEVETASEFVQNSTKQTDDIDILAAYLNDSEEPAEGKYNGNGSGAYIMETCLLDAAQIAAETEYLKTLLYNAQVNSMEDGQDCTNMLANPNFNQAGGWTAAQGIEWPMGTDAFHVFQAWGRVCDVYQELTGLQNGLYEMNLQAVYKTDGDEAIRQTYAYINDFDTKIGVPDYDSPINSADEASAAFAEGKYPVKVYGLVSDGKMRLGIANRLRTGEQGALWAGGVTLTYRARNAEALEAMVAALAPVAEELLDAEACGSYELEALNEALYNAKYAEDANAQYYALVALKNAIDAVKEGIELYKSLGVAIDELNEAIDNAPATADPLTIQTANTYLEQIGAAYAEKALNNEEAAAAIEQLKAYKVAILMGQSIATEDNPVDMTSAIVNNNFDPAKGNKDEKRIDGWVVSGALNGYKQYTCSFNKGTFDLHQDLTGLPEGNYKVTVHTYYRAGSYEEEEQHINAGDDTHLMKLYAGDEETSVMNLSEGAKDQTLPEGISTATICGITVPNGTSPSVACFEAGLYLNELRFTVGADGKATIGLKLDQTIGSNDYSVVGEWNLWYMGKSAPEVTEQDVTNLITNPDFDPAMGSKDEKRIDGWVVSGALNGYKQNTASFNKGTFDLHQDLSGLPKGNYKVTVHTYYRAGSYEEEEANINAGNDTHLMKLYAGDEETSVMNLSEGAKDQTLPEGISTASICGITVPNGTSPSVACFNAGLYLNELKFTVGDDGKATIGVKLDQTIGTNDYSVVGAWHLYYYGESQGIGEESDQSSLIVNGDFDPAKGNKDEKRIDGWEVSGALNGYKKNTASFNKGTFDLHQKISGLPEGTWKVTVHTFYRAGSYEEEEANINAGNDTHLCKMYAIAEDTYEKPVVNLSEGAMAITDTEVFNGVNTRIINGITVPDGTDASIACFNAGYYLNELPFYVGNGGEATIGLKLEQTIGTNDYVVVGRWNLYYYGPGNNVEDVPTSIEDVEIERTAVEAVPVAFYNMNGVRLSQPQRGINLIKMSDGRVVKVLVK